MNEKNAQVIIIGAGIAGLTAAWQLKQSGIPVLILEADQMVGGRMQSIQIEDALIDCGAQFLSSAYSIIPKLIKETGLSNELVEINEWVGFVRNKDIAFIHLRKPWHLVANHILSTSSMFHLLSNQLKLLRSRKKLLHLNDITTWIQYDNQLAIDWVIKNFGESAAQELISTLFNGIYFQSLNDSSAAMAAAVLAFSAYIPKTMTLTSGIGSLPKKLADNLTVKTGVLVSTIIEKSSGVKIISNVGEFNADYVILTVPAPIAKNIIHNPDKKILPLLETLYSSSIQISLLTQDSWLPSSRVRSVYGFLFNPQLDSKISSIAIENNKCHTRKKRGYLINILLTDKWAKKFFYLTDEEIHTEIQSDVEKLLPAIYSHLHKKIIFRWPYALPCTPIGRATAVKEYHDTRNLNNRAWLAGDYLGYPWADSAAQTGIWAANKVRHCLLKT